MDIKTYIDDLSNDIASIKIQGATNIAIACIEGMQTVYEATKDASHTLEIGNKLANIRLNEPMARNAVKYVKYKLENGGEISNSIDEYKNLIKSANQKIRELGGAELSKYDVILTHCHSSTSTASLIEASKLNQNLKVVSTETRPKMQGRLTSQELLDAGVDVTMIVDSVSASFIVDDTYLPVGALVIGTDELLSNGTVINKLGSYQIALAADKGNDNFYVATSLLKMDPNRGTDLPQIEMRDDKEVWPEVPEGIDIINPAFETVPPNLIDYFITEAGLIKPEEVLSKAKELYPWL